ncbi:MAG: hypothetical protein ACTHOH_15295 [Lysobacteraceae bacterium]
MEPQIVATDDRRVVFARMNRKRIAEARDRRVRLLLGGLLIYFGAGGVLSLGIDLLSGETSLAESPILPGLSALFLFAAWRHWRHDDTRLRTVGLASMVVIALDLLFAAMGHGLDVIGIVVNAIVIALLLWRRRTLAAANAADREASMLAVAPAQAASTIA